MTGKIFNFGAGPAMLPYPVMEALAQGLPNWNNTGISVLELGHRTENFTSMADEAERDFRDLLAIPDNYKVLFCQGGARGQFAAVPLNLLTSVEKADYIESGFWSRAAAAEGSKYCHAQQIGVTYLKDSKVAVQPMDEWPITPAAKLLHYCPNETIEGIAIDELPNIRDRIVVADMSSTLLSRSLDISCFGVIYACAQKNIGPAGISVVIVREDLLGNGCRELPSILSYALLSQSRSMYNTPPTFAWYCCGLVFKWLKSEGGLGSIAARNKEKATRLYTCIDHYPIYQNGVHEGNRSLMNVTFNMTDKRLEEIFLRESEARGLLFLKGHKVVGGLRASLYNAMPITGVESLTEFMADFARRYG